MKVARHYPWHYGSFEVMTVVCRLRDSQEAGSQVGPSRTGRHTRGEWRLPSLCDDGDSAPAGRALRLPPLPSGATFGQHYDIVLVVDSREQVPDLLTDVQPRRPSCLCCLSTMPLARCPSIYPLTSDTFMTLTANPQSTASRFSTMRLALRVRVAPILHAVPYRRAVAQPLPSRCAPP